MKTKLEEATGNELQKDKGAKNPGFLRRSLDKERLMHVFVDSLYRDCTALFEYTRQVLEHTINFDFIRIIFDRVVFGPNRLFVTGIGKSGAIARRFAGSMSLVGVPSVFVHAVELSHGDFGMMRSGDVLIIVSKSGLTGEAVNAAKYANERGIRTIAMTGNLERPLNEHVEASFVIPVPEEFMSRLPSRSIVEFEAVVNAIVAVVADFSGVDEETIRRTHPGNFPEWISIVDRHLRNLEKIKKLLHEGGI